MAAAAAAAAACWLLLLLLQRELLLLLLLLQRGTDSASTESPGRPMADEPCNEKAMETV